MQKMHADAMHQSLSDHSDQIEPFDSDRYDYSFSGNLNDAVTSVL